MPFFPLTRPFFSGMNQETLQRAGPPELTGVASNVTLYVFVFFPKNVRFLSIMGWGWAVTGKAESFDFA